jgi:hypothetical protein
MTAPPDNDALSHASVAGGGPPAGYSGHPSLALEILSRIGVGVVVGWILALVGIVMVIVGYFEVSGTSDVAKQLAYFSSADVGGVVCLGAAAVLILTSHYKQLQREVAHLRGRGDFPAANGVSAWPGSLQSTRLSSDPHASSQTLAKLPSSDVVHSTDCVFLADKEKVEPVSQTDATRRGLKRCQVCDPVL